MIIRSDTIIALATPLGQAPLAILRVSGEHSISITEKIFRSGKKISDSPGHEVVFGYIVNPQTQVDIDQVLVTVFKNPRSFTGENMIEITCHGGMIIFQKIIDVYLEQGCLLAEKGEFSKRAFMNNKMDLTQAEAIHDLIFSRSYKVNQMVLGSLKKNLYLHIQQIKSSILKLVAKIEVGIDYPEDDIEIWEQADKDFLDKTILDLQTIITNSKHQQTFNKGYTVAIIGEPNAGKSSLLNILAGEDKAIVSHIAGTTRDPIEVSLILNDVPTTLVDTAGIREQAENDIEQQGIAKTKNIMVTADLNILMIDSSEYNKNTIQKQIDILETDNIPYILVWNKIDKLTSYPKIGTIAEHQQIYLSCEYKEGIIPLLDTIKKALTHINISDSLFFINHRQSFLLEQVLFSLKETQAMLYQEEIELEILSILLQKALSLIGEIDGSDIKDNILETIFSEFCVGK